MSLFRPSTEIVGNIGGVMIDQMRAIKRIMHPHTPTTMCYIYFICHARRKGEIEIC